MLAAGIVGESRILLKGIAKTTCFCVSVSALLTQHCKLWDRVTKAQTHPNSIDVSISFTHYNLSKKHNDTLMGNALTIQIYLFRSCINHTHDERSLDMDAGFRRLDIRLVIG